MLYFVLTMIMAFVSANEAEQEPRRIVCGGLCIGLAGAALGGVISGGIGAGATVGVAAAQNSKRRRRMDGLYEDSVCVKTMNIVKKMPFLKDLLMNEGQDNMLPLDMTVDLLTETCGLAARTTDINMNQCTFYVSMAKLIGEEFLEGVWLNAFGSLKDQLHGCGSVVNFVNKVIDNGGIPSIRRAELENGQEVFITGEESSMSFRRLIGAAASGVVGAGMYLAHICRSFDESNKLIDGEYDMSFN